MILNYARKKMKEMAQECKSSEDCISFIERIPAEEIIENGKNLQEFEANFLLYSSHISKEEKFLLLHFYATIGKKEEAAQMIVLLFFPLYFVKPFEKTHSVFEVSPLAAYLGEKICDAILNWKNKKNNSHFTYLMYKVKANLVISNHSISSSDKRSRLLSIYKTASESTQEKDLESRIIAQASHNYGKALYDIYFSNPAYENYLEEAEREFEKAIEYRLKQQETAQDIQLEIETRVCYSGYLRKLDKTEKAEYVMSGILEKIQKRENDFPSQEEYLKTYIKCLNTITNIQEQKAEQHGENNNNNVLNEYSKKTENLIEKIIKNRKIASSEESIVLISNMILKGKIAFPKLREIFNSVMPEAFLFAKELLEIREKATEKQKKRLNEDNVFQYFMFLDIVSKIFDVLKMPLKDAVPVFNKASQAYFKKFKALLKINYFELKFIGNYGIASLKYDKKKNRHKGIFYCIFFLAHIELVQENKPEMKFFYYKVLQELYLYMQKENKLNELANILQLIQCLPWNIQQLRTIKSHNLNEVYKLALQLEIKMAEEFPGQLEENILSKWDEITLDMDTISTRMKCYYPPGHSIYKWQLTIELLIGLEKMIREFGGYSEIKEFLDSFRKEIITLLENNKIMQQFYDLNSFRNIFRSENFLNLLYQKEWDEHYNLTINEEFIKNKDLPYISNSPFIIGKEPFETLCYLARKNKVISLSCISKNLEVDLIKQDSFHLISSVLYEKNGKIVLENVKTILNLEEVNSLNFLSREIKLPGRELSPIISHFQKLYQNIPEKEKKSMIWIGSDFLQLFPIHILPSEANEKAWFDLWETIEFCSSLRELYLPPKGGYNTPIKANESLLLFGEQEKNDHYPPLGGKIYQELSSIEEIPIRYGEPLREEATENFDDEIFQVSSRKISYYGHFQYGHAFDPNAGFYSNGEPSNFNYLLLRSPIISTYIATERVELWGCESSALFRFASLDLPNYEHFAKQFLRLRVERAIATLTKIPDFTAALICENMRLREKVNLQTVISIHLKKAISWYRRTLDLICSDVNENFSLWLQSNSDLSEMEFDRKVFLELQKLITERINYYRQRFHSSLNQEFCFIPFSEEDIFGSFLGYGKVVLGRNSDENEEIHEWKKNPQSYSDRIIEQIFEPLKETSAWGSVILIRSTPEQGTEGIY